MNSGVISVSGITLKGYNNMEHVSVEDVGKKARHCIPYVVFIDSIFSGCGIIQLMVRQTVFCGNE